MNYLSHFFLEEDPLSASPYLTIGLVLPDLAGATQRGWKPVLLDETGNVIKKYEKPHPHQEMDFGVRRHLQADALFHNSEFFKTYTRTLRDKLEKQGFNIIGGARLFFVAHILLEMLLDRIIIKQHERIPEGFYSKLTDVELGQVYGYLQRTRPLDEARFQRGFGRFIDSRFLLSYVVDENLYFSLNRILERAAQPAFDQSRLSAFSDLILEAENELGSVYEAFFADMRKGMEL